ncbi:sulfotransferase domain-containing protein [Rugamonas rubra]|uniref:Sulfotransferase domain-containing protein n=1 Tax=Rugamonas rubra TaxID=758825 RepID=A0A1I4MZY3_9BURK|nr:sulfotransferase domain-containing protein [Rugamonas rubra]SFM08892.1 hypothetical protein SAMN02982985_02684 [Rugamonas rubra]
MSRRDEGFVRRVSRSGLPLFQQDDDSPVIWPRVRPGRPPALVVSLPRSGTHLGSELLQGLGLVFGGLHLSPELEPDIVQDRRSYVMAADGRLEWQQFQLPLEDLFAMVGPGQVVQGHVPFSPAIAAALAGFRIVYMERSLRDVAVSSMRFVAGLRAAGLAYPDHYDMAWCDMADGPARMLAYLRGFGGGLRGMLRQIQPWRAQPNSFVLDFDLLTGAEPAAAVAQLRALADFLGAPVGAERAERILRAALGRLTHSWSGRLSRWQELWDREVEQAFAYFVLDENAYFGMPDRLPTPTPAAGRPLALLALPGESGVRRRALAPDGARPPPAARLDPARCVGEGLRLEAGAGGLLLSALDHYADHQHASLPAAMAAGPVTFHFELPPGQHNSRHLVAQVGGAAGYFSSYIDSFGVGVTAIESGGDCAAIATRVEQRADGALAVAVAGRVAGGADCYVRIYLCGADGRLDRPAQARLTVAGLALEPGWPAFLPAD